MVLGRSEIEACLVPFFSSLCEAVKLRKLKILKIEREI